MSCLENEFQFVVLMNEMFAVVLNIGCLENEMFAGGLFQLFGE